MKKKYLFALLFLVILSPLVLFYTIRLLNDVSILKTHYPRVYLEKDRDVSIKFETKKPPYWATLKEISSFGKWAIILSEDWAFYQHHGFDLEQLEEAIIDMWEEGRFRGASTISQQMIKNIFLTDDRTLWRKMNEYILTHEAEKVLSKAKILEIYLNSIEFGPSVYGLRAASRHYFQKPPSGLSPREAAFIAMLLPSPKRYYVSFKKKKLTPFAKKRISAILEKMRMGKIITKERMDQEIQSRFFWELD